MPLIIVESPAKAKTISQFVGKEYTVKASVGHIRELSDAKKNDQDKKLEIAGVDIDNGFEPIFDITSGKKDVVKELKKLAKANKFDILFATDSDREGEAISWHLAQVLDIKDMSQIRRLEFHEITKKAIQEAVEHPRELNMNLVSAQRARQVLDRLVGFKLSPVLWKVMSNYHLSAGRVQSPALALICDREDEIEKFVPQEYWEIEGEFVDKAVKKPVSTWIKEDGKLGDADEFTKFLIADEYKEKENALRLKFSLSQGAKLPKTVASEEDSRQLTVTALQNTEYSIVDVAEKTEKSSSRPPFTTSTLQQAASSVLGYNPKLTMQLAQRLYEGVEIDGRSVGLITYMRTDSTALSQESLAAARKYIQSNFPNYLPDSPKFYKSKTRNAQEAHEAIRPVDPLLTPAQLKGKIDPKQLKLYELIWKQMVASQMTDEIRQRLTFQAENVSKDMFTGSVAWTTHLGFKALTGEKVVTENTLNIAKDQKIHLADLLFHQSFTKPPSRYSQASLIKKLEELGIGRPSTFATIISTLQERQYVEVGNGSQMKPTTLGRKINQLLKENFSEVTSSELTAEMEEELDKISRGETEYRQMLGDFWWDFKKNVESKSAVITENRDAYKTSQSDVKCPTCNGSMELKLGRFGEYFQCVEHKEHQFPKNFKEYEETLVKARTDYASQAEGKKCTECGKDLIVRVSKSSLNPYIACPDYQVGNKHTVMPINYGPCPKCAEEGRKGDKAGVLVLRKGFRGKKYIGCSLDSKVCGYIQK
ncbi:MAG: type I DNA topoisomerase [Patescibacteria group bacterium]